VLAGATLVPPGESIDDCGVIDALPPPGRRNDDRGCVTAALAAPATWLDVGCGLSSRMEAGASTAVAAAWPGAVDERADSPIGWQAPPVA
jgi:hypothetical protein